MSQTNHNMASEAVYYRIDTERTSGEAYYSFLSKVSEESPEENITYTHNQPKILDLADPSATANVVDAGVFLVKEVAAPVFAAWLTKEFLSEDEDSQHKVYQTGDGAVYIEEVRLIDEDEARERMLEDE